MLETAEGRLERRVTLSREQQAILRCQQGDLTGLEALFELHRQGVLRRAYGIVGRRGLAEDVTQQVFVELFTALKRFDRGRPFAPWLYRIVVNTSLKELRRQRPALSLDAETLDLPSLEPLPDQTVEESDLRRSMVGGDQVPQAEAPSGRGAPVLPRLQRGRDGRCAQLPPRYGEVPPPLCPPAARGDTPG